MIVTCIAATCPAQPPSRDDELSRRIEEASRRIEQRPSDASLLVDRARLFQARGQWIDMKRDLDRAVELAPRDALARGLRGLANAILGDHDRAMSDVDAAISLEPRHAFIHGLRGNLLLNMGRTEDAIASLDRSIALDPTASVHFDRGFCHQRDGDLQASIADYTAAYRLDPTLLAAVRERGHAHQLAGDFARAVEDFEFCRRREPDEPQTELSLAWILATCPDAGIRNGRRALMIAGELCDPVTCQTAEPLNALAAAYAELGEFEKAEVLQERAVALSYFAPEFREVSGRRLNAIRNHRPIREANVPLAVLPRFPLSEPPAVDFDQAMAAPADVLALRYLETGTLLGTCPIAKAGATVDGFVDGQPIVIDASNADRVSRGLEERRRVFANAIRKRGHATLSTAYTSRAEGGCIEWGLDGNPVLVEQNGFDLLITEGDARHTGVVVGSCVAFVHDMNTVIMVSGTISGDTITFVTAQRGGVTGMATERCRWTLTATPVEGAK
jgi:tetratricopeptide (TPR) repeat protein